METNKKHSIYDVAELAGVSTTTVSRVMTGNNYPVRPETRNKILKAASELSYLPEQRNRIRRQVFEEIAVVIPSVTNPYYSLLLDGVKKVLCKRKRCIYICDTGGDLEQEKMFIESLKAKRIKGAIISSVAQDYEHICSLIQYGMELVFFDQRIEMECNKIVFNYEKGGYMATEHLIDLGHRKIAFMGMPLTRESRKSVLEGYKNCLIKNDISYNKNFVKIPEAGKEPLDIMEQTELFLADIFKGNDLPTAIFCVNDLLAICVMHGLEERGIRVPDDISIMGFDNIEMCRFVKPKLSTIDQCAYETGILAATMLVGSFKDNKQQNVSVFMEPKLIKRETTIHPYARKDQDDSLFDIKAEAL